jgi:restriction system protein
MPALKSPPLFARFMWPIVEALRRSGGAARASEVTALVIELSGVSEDELEQVTAAGLPRIKNQIHWARYYLVRAGLIDASERGVWRLTNIGSNAQLDEDSARAVLKFVRALPATPSGNRTAMSASIGERKGPIRRPSARATASGRRASR